MSARRPRLLAAVVAAVWSADADQLPLTSSALASRVWKRLGGFVVTAADVEAAAVHLLPVGLVARDGTGWRPGLVRPEWAPVAAGHERGFWAAREAVGRWPG